MTPCTRCHATGFLNIEHVPEEILHDPDWARRVIEWMNRQSDTDVQICDCCGNGEDWYGTPGGHYGPDDPRGDRGPYRYNGGLCECH